MIFLLTFNALLLISLLLMIWIFIIRPRLESKITVEALRKIGSLNSIDMAQMLLLLQALAVAVAKGNEGTFRIEQANAIVADNLEIAHRAVQGVAADLEEAHKRADLVEGAPGEAADAASYSPKNGNSNGETK